MGRFRVPASRSAARPHSAPTSQALAIGNEALNALSALASTMLTDTAGLVNAQANSTGAEALLQDNFVGVDLNPQYPETGDFGYGEDGGDISDTSITVGTGATGGSNPNILRALAYGNQASNVLSASAGTVNPDATAGSFSVDGSYIGDSAPYDTGFFDETFYGVGAAYGLLNDQTAAGTIAAAGEDVYLGIDIGNASTNPALTGVTASTAGNAVVASAFGNQASNSATVAADNLDAEEYYPVADVTNLQTNDGTLSASLSVVAGYPMLTTDVFATARCWIQRWG